MSRSGRRDASRGVAFVTALWAAYALVFVWNGSFVVDGERFFTLFDDAMISMRYARNLAGGHGPVWNPGEPAVEGYTNPLWMAYMALWHLLPLPASKTALPIQLSGLAANAATLLLLGRIAGTLVRPPPGEAAGGQGTAGRGAGLAAVLAAALTALYLPFTVWSLRGLETSVLGLLLAWAVWRALEPPSPGEGARPPASLFVALAVGVMVRLDFALPAAVLLGWLFVVRPRWRRAVLAGGALAIGGALALQTAGRLAIYGAWLPNTYHLKMTGVETMLRVRRGVAMAAAFVGRTAWPVFLLPAAWVALARRGDPRVWLPVALFGGQLAYSAWVGGDAWEWWGHGANRFVMPALPLWFVVASLALADALGAVRRAGRGARAALAAAALGLAALALHGGPRGVLLGELVQATGLHVDADERQVRYALALREITGERAVIAVAWAGAVPYFSERRAVDVLGKSDPRVARGPIDVRSWRELTPGHDKHDFAWSLGQLRPDVVAHSYHAEDDPYLEADYRAYDVVDPRIADEYIPRVWLRRGSPHVRWDRVSRARWLRPAAGAAR